MINFGTPLKIYRIRKGLKQTEVADKAGIESTFLCAVECNKKMPSITLIKKLAKILGVKAEVIFLEGVTLEKS
jgi:transcriptional regulator with XRE-family HTH domain